MWELQLYVHCCCFDGEKGLLEQGKRGINHAGHGFAQEQAINLVRLGANIHVQQRMYKSTPLHQAVSAGSLELVKCLIDAGADVAAVDWNGFD